MDYSQITKKASQIDIGRMAIYNEHAEKLMTAEALLVFRTKFCDTNDMDEVLKITKLQNDVLQHTMDLMRSCAEDELMRQILMKDTTLTGGS